MLQEAFVKAYNLHRSYHNLLDHASTRFLTQGWGLLRNLTPLRAQRAPSSEHLTYGISAWRGVSHSKLGKIFSIQKRCLRLLFGKVFNFDHAEFYQTCARVRTYDEHMTPKDFSLEHTKPLFREMKLLTVHHLYFLYTLNCIRELFKIRNYSCPISILSMLKHAHQYSGKHLKLTTPNYTMRRSRIQFLYKCT